jgi:aryl-alcohol dehydrogenase-like predicted oxidoreductase
MQNYLNLLYREEQREMLPLCRDQGVGVIPWSPLARGRLARDWNAASARAETDAFGRSLYAETLEADRKVVEALGAVAARLGLPRAQVALAWVLQQPGVTAPIVGATRLEQLDDAVAALGVTLSAEDVAELEKPYVPHAVVGFS